jgi:hypothetical protein
MKEKLREGGSVTEGKRVRESEAKTGMRERAVARGERRRGRKRKENGEEGGRSRGRRERDG